MLRWVFLWVWMLALPTASAAAVVDGRLDLQGAALGPRTHLELSGNWLFYPKVFLEAGDFAQGLPADKPSVLAPVPGELADVRGPDGQALGDQIYGSFVLELRNFPVWAPELALRLRGDTAYRVLLVDGNRAQVITQAGLPGPRPQESIPQIIEQLGRFQAPAGAGPFYLVVQLSGFFYVKPSLWVTPTIGPTRLMERERDWVRLSEFLVVGMLLIMSLYNCSLYIHRREDSSNLWLAGFNVLIMLRFIATSGYMTAFLFPNSTADLYEFLRKVEFGSVALSASCLLIFAAHTFGFPKFEKHQIWNHAPVGLLTAAILLSDATFFPKLLPLIILHTLFVSTSVLAMVVISMRRRREGSLLALIGLASVVLCGYHDILIGLGKLTTPVFLMPYGMVVLIYSQGQVIARLFASAFRTADHLSKHLAEEVEKQTRDIRSMLDHIPQGVMSLVAPGVIDPGVSRHLLEVLVLDKIDGLTLDQALLSRSSFTADDRERIQAALNSVLGEEALAFELNCGQLPGEIRLNLENSFKILQMTWNPVMDRNDVIVKILITCHDVTEVRRYEAEASEQKQELGYIQELVNVSAEKFSIFYETSIRMLDENQRLVNLNRNRNFEILKILFVNMHTIKGAARTLGFGKLTAWLHEVEQTYAQLLKEPELVWDQQKLVQDVSLTIEKLEYYKRVNEQKLGRVLEKAWMIPVDREFLVQHTQMLKKMEHEVGGGFGAALVEALARFEELAFQDSYAVLNEVSAPAGKIAKDLGKAAPQIEITGLHCGMSFQAQQLLRKVFIHILRNALDHGIETTEERVKHGKKPDGTIHVNLTETRNRLQIAISDDGRGLSLQKLERRAQELGILSGSQPRPIEELAELIFYPGLSTADSLTEVSGRGIGMDAVKSFIEEAGGSIRVALEEGQFRMDHSPFSLVISLPSTLYLRKSEGPRQPLSTAS